MENEGTLTEAEAAEMFAEATVLGLDEQFGCEATTRSFAEAGLMTSNDGFVVRLQDGTEYQVTVRRSA